MQAGTEGTLLQVLLIDDNPLQLRIRETVLRGAGFPVSIATTAESALALLRTPAFAADLGVIVTDHILPGATGSDFVRHLRQTGITIPVVVLSGLPEAGEEYAGLDVSFRQKPFPPAELIALVRQHLRTAA
jgi:DNA-binding response OmpR family regulator